VLYAEFVAAVVVENACCGMANKPKQKKTRQGKEN
jgi:hypothetical protein